MKSNYSFVPTPASLGNKYKFLQPYDPTMNEEDGKIRGKIAHYSFEHCRLEKLIDCCSLGSSTDLNKNIITEEDKKILESEMNEALLSLLSQSPF